MAEIFVFCTLRTNGLRKVKSELGPTKDVLRKTGGGGVSSLAELGTFGIFEFFQ